jgi:hypothetical protein
MSVTFTMELTGSQKLALVDALLELIRIPDTTQKFVDCSRTPAVETTVTELLELVAEAKANPGPAKVREWKARQ